MALSLAACGGSSTTVTTPVVETPVVDTPVVETPTVTAASLALTADNDIFDADDFTTVADAVTATQATYATVDVIAEPNSGDGDTLTITTNADITATPTIVGIENILVNSSQFNGAGDGIEFAADRIANGTVTLNNVQVGSGDDEATLTAAGNITVVAGTGVSALVVTQAEDATATVHAGSATSLSYTSVAGTGMIATVVANGDLALTTADTAGTMTDLNVTSTVASEVTLTDNGNLDTITADANTTLVGVNDLADFSGFSITGAAAVEGIGAISDVTGIAAAINITDATTSVLTIASGASVTAELEGLDLTLTAEDDDDSDTDVESSATVALTDDSTDAPAGGGYAITLNDSADDGSNEITTLNLVVTGDLDHDAAFDGDVAIDTTANALATTLNLRGAGDIDLVVSSSGTDSVTLNASAMTGDLTTTATAEMLSVTGGTGDDNIEARTAVEFVLAGGEGTDTLRAAADMTSGTFAGFEILTMDDNDAFVASQLSGQTMVVTAITGSINVSAASAIDITTIDMSGLTAAQVADDIDIDLGDIDAAIVLAGAAITYTGWNGVDTVAAGANGDTISTGAGADVITGGAGDDTITTGAGIDAVTSGDGNDTIDLTEATAAVDTLNYAADDGAADVDTITGFNTGTTDDIISLDVSATTTAITVGDATAAAATAAGAVAVTNHADDTDLDLSADTDETIIKLTDAGSTFAEAIGTGEITVVDTAVMNFLWYDSDTSEAVFGYAAEATAADADDAIAADDTFVEIARLALTADEYTALGTDNFVMI